MKTREPILKIYDENVEWYMRERTQTLREKKYLDQIIKELPLNGTVLDLGCATGQPIAAYFMEKGFKVTGVDGAKHMIKKAQELSPQTNWIHADMRTLDLNLKFNAVLAWNSFFHLLQDEQRLMFSIFQKHLISGGILAFTSGPEAGEAIGDMNGFELYHSSLSTEEYNNLLYAEGFEVLNHQIEDPECGGLTVWIARKK
jgi:trans-aconitate methyltransferase